MLVFLILKARFLEKKQRKLDEEKARKSEVSDGRAQLHSECVSSPGPHEMLDEPRPPEAENMGSEKVELPANFPCELYGDEYYIPAECDAGSVHKPCSSSRQVPLPGPYTMQVMACMK